MQLTFPSYTKNSFQKEIKIPSKTLSFKELCNFSTLIAFMH